MLGTININTTTFFTVMGILIGIAATVLLYIFVLPENKREKLPKILKVLHDIFNMKQLWLETFLRGLYVLSSTLCITVGACMLFSFSIYDSGRYSYSHWYGGYGILLAILGPVVLRIVFEGLMMFILLVKNTIQINNKLKADADQPKEEKAATEEPQE